MENKIIIIIDGIDVSKCEFAEIFDGKCLCNCVMGAGCERTPKKVISIYCNENQFCDFKELARAKEENEKLKARLQTLDDETVTVQLTQKEYERLKAKEQECEELKSNNKILSDMWKTADRNNAKHVVKIDKYKQALDSIEHICRNVLDDDYIRNLAFALLDIINKATNNKSTDKITNRERLNQMTNEELATFFANLSKRCPHCKYYDALPTIHFNKHCYTETLKWLEQESEQ